MYAAPQDPKLWQSWFDATSDPALVAGIERVHQDIADAIAQRQPRCDQSGRCCHFADYGHDLFVTGLEIALFIRQLPPTNQSPDQANDQAVSPLKIALPLANSQASGSCPYLVDQSCSTHTIRPSGCRIFFCEPGSEDWQQSLYEASLTKVRVLHESHHLPYRYMEWLDGLATAKQLGLG